MFVRKKMKRKKNNNYDDNYHEMNRIGMRTRYMLIEYHRFARSCGRRCWKFCFIFIFGIRFPLLRRNHFISRSKLGTFDMTGWWLVDEPCKRDAFTHHTSHITRSHCVRLIDWCDGGRWTNDYWLVCTRDVLEMFGLFIDITRWYGMATHIDISVIESFHEGMPTKCTILRRLSGVAAADKNGNKLFGWQLCAAF